MGMFAAPIERRGVSAMNRSTTFIISAAAGIAFGVLFLFAAFLPGPPPGFGATGDGVVAFYQGHGGAQAWANFLKALGWSR